MADDPTATAAGQPRKAADSPRWCERCQKYGDHHTDRHDECAPATAAHCPTHAVCPTCREGWGHYTAGVGYSPTIESERVRRAYLFPEWLTGFPPYDVAGITSEPARSVLRD